MTKPFAFYCLNTLAAWRHFSILDLARLVGANVFGSALAFGILTAFCPVVFPRSILVLDLALCILLTAGTRVMAKMAIEYAAYTQRGNPTRALIYGAGAAGILLLQE